jgi:hypothetical protein
LGDHSTQRDANQVHLLESEGVEQTNQIFGKILQGVWSRRNVAASMAPNIVRQHTVRDGELRNLRLPKPVIEAQRVNQDDRGSATKALIELTNSVRDYFHSNTRFLERIARRPRAVRRSITSNYTRV